MAITRISVSNFKSFDELELGLRPLSIVIGANAAGKSNFLEIFRFLRDWFEQGLENAVSLQGGMEYLANLRIGASRPVTLEFDVFSRNPFDPGSFSSRVVLESQPGSPGFRGRTDLRDPRGEVCPEEIKAFDLDPGLAKKAIPLSGRAELEPDASNLAIVLRRLLQDDESRQRFIRVLRDCLPFVEDLRIEHFADKSLLIALREQYSQASYLPAAFLSDGTIHLIALILALYFERGDVVLIEEPERNLHPALISKVAGLLKDASQHKQILVTTHNPELVKHADLEDLLLVHRDEDGFSRVTRPAESAELRVFLENDLGVDELYVQNLLGVGNAL